MIQYVEIVNLNKNVRIVVQFVKDYGRRIKMINQSNVMSVRCGFIRNVIKSLLLIPPYFSNIVVIKNLNIVVHYADNYSKWPSYHK
jgi:hypothetical protein